MSKALAHYPEAQRMAVAMRRTSMPTRGCSYWGAVGFLNKHGVRTKEQALADAVDAVMQNVAAAAQATKREEKRGKTRKFRPGRPVSSLDERSKRVLASYKRR